MKNPLIVRTPGDVSELAVVPLPDKAEAAFNRVIAAHSDEFAAVAAQHGVDWETVATPSWSRFIHIEEARDAVARFDAKQQGETS